MMNNCFGNPRELINNEQYEVDIKFHGQNVMVNGQPIKDPNGYYLVIFQDDNTAYPYDNEKCVERHWKVKMK